MSFVASAIVASSVVGAVTSSKAAKKAAKASKAGSDASIAEQRRQYDTTRRDYTPYRAAGTAALGRMQDPNAFETSPGYEWRREEGTRNMENRFSVGGGGGNAMRALTEFNQGLASNEYGNWWNRQAGMANLGMGAAHGTAAAGQNASNNISNTIMQDSRNQQNAIYNRYSGINNAVQSGLGNYMYAKGNGLLGYQGGPFDSNQGSPNEFEFPYSTPPFNPYHRPGRGRN